MNIFRQGFSLKPIVYEIYKFKYNFDLTDIFIEVIQLYDHNVSDSVYTIVGIYYI